MKKLGKFLVTLSIIFWILMITLNQIASYQYERDHQSYWNLSVKASTIEQKAQYMDKFVASFLNKGFEGKYNTILFPTPDNSFDKNYEALVSLKIRLDEIQKMDISSLQYQTAIQQITQQEQGEAQSMLDVFSGIWCKWHYPLLWDGIAALLIIVSVLIFLYGIVQMAGGWKAMVTKMNEMEARNRRS